MDSLSPRHYQGMFIVADVDFPEVYPEMIADVGAPLPQPEDQPPVEADLAGLPDDESSLPALLKIICTTECI
jgi:hypothetical protein